MTHPAGERRPLPSSSNAPEPSRMVKDKSCSASNRDERARSDRLMAGRFVNAERASPTVHSSLLPDATNRLSPPSYVADTSPVMETWALPGSTLGLARSVVAIARRYAEGSIEPPDS